MSMTVIQHVLSRLRDVGIHDVFGVLGDLSFPLNDVLCSELIQCGERTKRGGARMSA